MNRRCGAICLVDANNIITRHYYGWEYSHKQRGEPLKSAVERCLRRTILSFATAPYGRTDRLTVKLDHPEALSSQTENPMLQFLSASESIDDSSDTLLENEYWANDMVFVFDSGYRERKDIFAAYKEKKRDKSPELVEAIEIGKQFLASQAQTVEVIRKDLGLIHRGPLPRSIHVLPDISQSSPAASSRNEIPKGVISAEADDLIYTFIRRLRDPCGKLYPEFLPELSTYGKGPKRLTKKQEKLLSSRTKELPISLSSNDGDLKALLGYPGVVLHPDPDKTLTSQDVESKLGYPLRYFGARKALLGDKSDNIPGLPDVGEKKATELIGKYDGSLRRLLKDYKADFPKGYSWTKALDRDHQYLQRMESLARLSWVEKAVPSIEKILKLIDESAQTEVDDERIHGSKIPINTKTAGLLDEFENGDLFPRKVNFHSIKQENKQDGEAASKPFSAKGVYLTLDDFNI